MRKQTAAMTRQGFSTLMKNVRKRAGSSVLGLSYISSLIIDELMDNWEFYKKEIKESKENEEENENNDA